MIHLQEFGGSARDRSQPDGCQYPRVDKRDAAIVQQCRTEEFQGDSRLELAAESDKGTIAVSAELIDISILRAELHIVVPERTGAGIGVSVY